MGNRWQKPPVAAAALVAFLGAGLFVERATSRFAGAGHDDTFITLLAAEMLADGEGLLSSDGKPGEIGSSLLHVICLALLRSLGFDDLYLVNKLFGLLCGLLAVGLVLFGGDRFFPRLPRATRRLAALASFLFAISLPTGLFWTLGGLETPLVAVLLTGLGFELARGGASSPGRVALLSCLLVLARPEGGLYLAAVGLVGFLNRVAWRWFVFALGAPALVLLALTLGRQAAFGVTLPLPALAKLSAESPLARVRDGWEYLLAFCEASWVGLVLLVGFAASVLFFLGHRGGRALGQVPEELAPAAGVQAIVGAHLSAVLLSGGDWMAFYRFVAPALPLLGVATVQAFTLLTRRVAPRLVQLSLPLVGVLALVGGEGERSGLFPPYIRNTSLQEGLEDLFDPSWGSTFTERVRLLNHPYFRDHTQLVPFLDGPLPKLLELEPNLTIATYQMGFLPYHARRRGLHSIRFLDTMGITNGELARAEGARSPRGLEEGLEPAAFLDPDSDGSVARVVQRRAPHLVYVLTTDEPTVAQLDRWGWVLFWNAPDAKIFLRRTLLDEFLARENLPP